MAVFDFPRINVYGTHLANPCTANNNSLSPGSSATVTSNTETVEAMTQGMSDEEFVAWMGGLDETGKMLRAQWNYYGDMAFRFLDVRVTSVQLGYGELLADPGQDALVGSPLLLANALMCDDNPEGFDTTQIFSGGLEIQSPGAFADGMFLTRQPTRATTRSLNWFRNVSYHGSLGDETSGGAGGAAANFQSKIEVRPEDLAAAPVEGDLFEQALHRLLPTDASPGAQALASAIKSGGAAGLVFRYSLYLTYPRISDPDLAGAFARGATTPNPAIGQLVGTIAPWYPGEPESFTLGRYLKSAKSYNNPYRADHKPYYLCPVVARVDKAAARVSLDISNSFPEDGPEGYKYNMGTVSLGIRKATEPGQDPASNQAEVTVIGDLTNTREFYQLHGGIEDLALAPELRKSLDDPGQELVVQTSLMGVLLYEPEYLVQSDCSCSYLDELGPGERWDSPDTLAFLAGEPFAALRGEVPLYVRQRGKVPAGDVAVKIEQWKMTPTGDPKMYGAYRYPILLDTETFTVSGGEASYRLVPRGGDGLRLFRLVAPGQWPAQMTGDVLANKLFEEYFTTLRVLPYDDYSGMADSQLTFSYVYGEILRYYRLIFPAMNDRLPLSDPGLWQTPAAARYLLRVTDPGLWDNWLYMPRTRDLSCYRRELLRRFCRLVLREFNAEPGEPVYAPEPASIIDSGGY